MSGIVVAITGPVASGKTSLARRLTEHFGAVTVTTRELLRELDANRHPHRHDLQALAETLDEDTHGEWVAAAVAMSLDGRPNDTIVVVDSPRTDLQLDALNVAYGDLLAHIHLTATLPVLERRYLARPGVIEESSVYLDVRASTAEAEIEHLAGRAGLRVDTSFLGEEAVCSRVVQHLARRATT